jgi:hypothetical protein
MANGQNPTQTTAPPASNAGAWDVVNEKSIPTSETTVPPDGGPLGHLAIGALGALAGQEASSPANEWDVASEQPTPAALQAPTGPTTISAPGQGSNPFRTAGTVLEHIANIPTNPIAEISNDLNALTNKLSQYTQTGQAEHPFLSAIGDKLNAARELLAGGQAAGKPLGTSSGVLTSPVTTALSLAPAGPEVAGAAEARIGEALAARRAEKAAEAAKTAATEIPEIKGEWFTKLEAPQPQHGTPVSVESPFDRATINNLPGGKDLSEEAVNTLKGYTGDTIPVGSTAKNTLMRAVTPVQRTLEETGLKMNQVIAEAEPFKSSVLTDPTSTLIQDLAKMRENLPLREEDPLNKVVDKQLEAAYPALESTEPSEVLALRRKLGTQIDWNNITRNPETAGEAKNLTQVKIYNALGEKLHTEIPETVELDKIFQPNLELRSHLAAKLGKALVRNPLEADAMQAAEHQKGLRQLSVEAHNAKVARNQAIARQALVAAGVGALGAGLGVEALKQ